MVMRNHDDNFLPQRFRLPEKDTRRFYEKPEWWVVFVKWAIIVVLFIGAIGFGTTFAMGKWKERKHRLEVAAQEARLREMEETKAREAKAAAQKAEKEAKEKARAEAKAEKERIRREKREAEEQRRAEAEQRRKELESREKGPRRVSDLEKQKQTAGVRWWGKGTPPKFADRRDGDEYWCVFPSDRGDTMVRVKVGPDKEKPASVDLAEGTGYMRAYEQELLDEAVEQRPHLVIMDQAAWVRIPAHMAEKAAHVTVPKRLSFRPAEVLMGEGLYQLVRSHFRSNNRLDRLDCNVEFHWRNETHPPITWRMKFDESLGSAKLNHAIEDVLQAELDAANRAAEKKRAARQPDRANSLSPRGNSLAGSSRSGRRLGENYKTLGGSDRQDQRQEEAKANETPRQTRVAFSEVERVIDEGYLSASFAE